MGITIEYTDYIIAEREMVFPYLKQITSTLLSAICNVKKTFLDTALTAEIEGTMNQLQKMSIMFHKPSQIREYLIKYPDIIRSLLSIANITRETFGLDRFMYLDVYEGDDSSNLVFYIRQESYEEPILEKIDKIMEKYKEELVDKSGKIRLASDFEIRFAGLDLDYYKQVLLQEQFKLLIETIGIIPAPENFDPNEILDSEDL